MLKYFLKRIVSSVITIFMIITITFFLMKAIPGNPFADEKMPNPEIRAAMMEKYGLNKPVIEQYFVYLGNFIRGDFGVSYTRAGITVNKVIADGFPYSLTIGLYASLIVVFAGIGFGAQSEQIHRPFLHGAIHARRNHTKLCACNGLFVHIQQNARLGAGLRR